MALLRRTELAASENNFQASLRIIHRSIEAEVEPQDMDSEGVRRPAKGRIALNLRKPVKVAGPSSKSAPQKPNIKKPTLVPKDRRQSLGEHGRMLVSFRRTCV